MIQYTTKTYSIRLDEKKGHISYLKMCQKECIRDTLLPLFQIQMRDEKGQIHRVNTYDGKLVSKEENGNRYTLIYRGFEPYQLEVIVYLGLGFVIARSNIAWNGLIFRRLLFATT